MTQDSHARCRDGSGLGRPTAYQPIPTDTPSLGQQWADPDIRLQYTINKDPRNFKKFTKGTVSQLGVLIRCYKDLCGAVADDTGASRLAVLLRTK
jgi:hypothetical protein